MSTPSYDQTREKLTTYFDQTASAAWEKLTSDAPVGKIRATVRAGRDEMQSTLLAWFPEDLTGKRVLDAGCGTGTLAIILAQRGAEVVATDISPTLVGYAQQRAAESGIADAIQFEVGDMLDPSLGEFDYVVAMDSLIHYKSRDIARALAGLAPRVRQAMFITYAPRTPALTVMHVVGRMIPTREHKAPAIVPVSERALYACIENESALTRFQTGRTHRVSSTFYKSQALEVFKR
ncbi:MAG: magnesium protoporphyrin IX methyltransferase [Woeseiaceae bacterium]